MLLCIRNSMALSWAHLVMSSTFQFASHHELLALEEAAMTNRLGIPPWHYQQRDTPAGTFAYHHAQVSGPGYPAAPPTPRWATCPDSSPDPDFQGRPCLGPTLERPRHPNKFVVSLGLHVVHGPRSTTSHLPPASHARIKTPMARSLPPTLRSCLVDVSHSIACQT